MNSRISVLLIVGNLIFAGFFFFTIISLNSLEVPIFDVDIKVLDFTPDNIKIQAIFNISNPNSEGITIHNLTVTVYDSDGNEIGVMCFPDAAIQGFKESSLLSAEEFSIEDIGMIRSEISGRFCFSVFNFFTKNMPIHIHVTTIIPDYIQILTLPVFSSSFRIQGFNETGIQFTGLLNIENSNKFEIFISNLTVYLANNVSLDYINLSGGIIHPKGFLTIPIQGVIDYKMIDKGSVDLVLKGVSRIRAAGMSFTMPFHAETEIEVPSLANILFNNFSGGLSMNEDIKFTLKGVLATVRLGITNPTSLTFSLTNISWIMFRKDGDIKRVVGSDVVDSYIILPKHETWVTADILIPYSRLFPESGEHLLPDSLEVTFKGLASIQGSNQYVPIFLTGSILIVR